MYRAVIILFFLLILPDSANAANGFVPCSGPDCSACDFATMANTILQWLIGVLFVVFAVIMAVAGFGLVTSGGNPSAKEAAKSRFVNAIVGLIIVLGAWVLVDTIMRGLLVGTEGAIEGYGFWSEVQCQSQEETRIVDNPAAGTDGSGASLTPAQIEALYGPIGGAVTSPGGDTCFVGRNGVYDGGRPDSDDICIDSPNVSGGAYNLADGSGLGYTAPPGYFHESVIETNPYLSPNLRLCDVTRCDAGARAGDYIYIDPFMVQQLEGVRSDLGGFRVNSGYRSPAYNRGVDGATHSRHQYGDAVDIAVTASNPESAIIASCRSRGATNIYTYDSGAHVHCDWRGAKRE